MGGSVVKIDQHFLDASRAFYDETDHIGIHDV
jgi:hypothetical protein